MKPCPSPTPRSSAATSWRWLASAALLSQIARDFGISEATLHNALRKADVDDGVGPRVTTAEAEELRELKRRIRLLEQENKILRWAAAFFVRELPLK